MSINLPFSESIFDTDAGALPAALSTVLSRVLPQPI
jgi:hypothetical protein